MGTLFRITLYAEHEKTARIAADSAFQIAERLNAVFSDYDPKSELSRLSATAGSGKAVPVSGPLFEVLTIAQKISIESEGAFDITAGPYTRLWRESIRGLRAEIPEENELRELARSVGYRNLKLYTAEQTAQLLVSGMKLDPGGIAKGYTADQMMNFLNSIGFHQVLIDAGGDVVLGEAPPGSNGWRIIIPAHDKAGKEIKLEYELENVAITNSGDLYQYIEQDGIRYSHIIDPRTGTGVPQRTSVTVVGNKGVLVDALATTLNILSADDGMALIDHRDGYHARIEIHDHQMVKIYQTSWFDKHNNTEPEH